MIHQSNLNNNSFLQTEDNRKFVTENTIDNTHPHNQSYIYNQLQQFTDAGANHFNSHTMDSRVNQITAIPTSLISGTYINSNIIVH